MPLSANETERAERYLRRSIAKRDAIVAQVQFLLDLAHKVEGNEDILPLFRARKRDIDNLRAQFATEQDNILDLLLQLDRESEYELVHVPIGNKLIENYYFIIAVSDAVTDSSLVRTSSNEAIHPDNCHIQLPKIDLPKFDGNLIKWSSFRDTFVSLVHENSSVGNLHKFHYLLTCVSGSPLTVVKSIPLSAVNYKIAWEALVQRYDNKRLLATAHLEKVFSFRPIASESLPSLLTFVNVFQENISAVQALGVTDLAGFILFFIGSRALDPVTRQHFENSVSQDSIPTFDVLLKFIQQRCKVLENIHGSEKIESRFVKIKPNPSARSALTIATTTNSLKGTSAKSNQGKRSPRCLYCQQDHYVYRCSAFQNIAVDKRREFALRSKLCFSCLTVGHVCSACPSKYNCKKCGDRHHTLLHLRAGDSTSPRSSSPNQFAQADLAITTEQQTKFVGMSYARNTVVLGTAIVRMRDHDGELHPVRILLDSGSQISAITSECANRVGLTRQKCHTEVLGLAQNPVTSVKGQTECCFTSGHTMDPVFNCKEVLILPRITQLMPAKLLPPAVRTHYQHLLLADPQFDKPARIDMLIDCDMFPYIVRPNSKIIHTKGLPSALDTYLGWILVGTVIDESPNGQSTASTSLSATISPSLGTLLQKFWAVEEPVAPDIPTTEDELCEKWFVRTASRNATGRFCVALPFRDDVFSEKCAQSVNTTSNWSPSHGLGESRSMALKRLFNLEQRLSKDQEMYEAYRKFMDDYISLGHMKLASRPGKYFIPHHAVVKRDGDASTIRVVFDASAKSSSGMSLNDVMCTGPKLQTDIGELLLKCRLYKFIFIADIVKMYRQISVRDEDCVYQHILWRRSPDHEVQEFELLTVTYGLSSAPFLAIRVLHALDAAAAPQFAMAKGILTHNTYVDDIVVGSNTEEELVVLKDHIVGLLQSAGCSLKKWSSNSSMILDSVHVDDRARCSTFDPKDDPSMKVLGLHWDPHTDSFGYHTSNSETKSTKRGILSTIAKLFDPIGILGPTLMYAKIIMQQLWKNQVDWDAQLPTNLSTVWNSYASEMPSVRLIQVARHIDVCDYQDIQLLGFCDASQTGYAGTVYLRVRRSSGEIRVYLLTGKTKVTPLRAGGVDASLTIPRLELCAALLLAQLLRRLHDTVSPIVHVSRIQAWTDSSVVLSWLTTEQKMFKIFVTNRVAKIRALIPNCSWSHISTTENPADPSSRGLLPNAQRSCSIHWDGPSFIRRPESDWPISSGSSIAVTDLPEVKPREVIALTSQEIPAEDTILHRFSSCSRMQRSLGYALRFIDNVLLKRPRLRGSLTCSEQHRALMFAVRLSQKSHFPGLIKQLLQPNTVIIPPTMAQLAPFFDPEGIIRVGGRLRFSDVSYDAKHPILLPRSSRLTELLISHYHVSFLHGGPKLIVSMLSQRFWILSARAAVRRVIFACVPFTRHKSIRPQPMMSDLPPFRVQPHRPFSHVGMDYGGPFHVKESRRRNAQAVKVYLALFICMSVKAVHLEIVTDLSTEAFLAALDRFVARRGVPSNIYSDCGTNFVGAARQLKSLFRDPMAQDRISSHLACSWHFNPPAAPHFGGIWEAGIKSAKSHLKYVIGQQILTYEELHTLITRVEGILNSRPLTPTSSDPHDLSALTPGHFLIGQPIHALPEPDISDTKINRLNRWQLIRQCHQSYWKRWSREYLTSLQSRSKWFKQSPNLKVNDMVIVEAHTRPPTEWRLGRVIDVHPGPDGVTRVVSVRTETASSSARWLNLCVFRLNPDRVLIVTLDLYISSVV